MKAIAQYITVVLFSKLYKIDLAFKSVVLILKCDHSNESSEQYFPVVFLLFVILLVAHSRIYKQDCNIFKKVTKIFLNLTTIE